MNLRKVSNKNLLFNTLGRQTPMLLLFVIAQLLAVPVFCMLCFSALFREPSAFQTLSEYSDYLHSCAAEAATMSGHLLIILSAALGIFAGFVVCRYLMNWQSAVLFASIPVRREKQFAVMVASGLLIYLAALALTALISVVIFASHGCLAYAGNLYRLMLAGTIWYIFFYALTLFAGMLSGMSTLQGALLAAAFLYLPVTVGVLGLFCRLFYNFWNLSYLWEAFWHKLSALFGLTYYLVNLTKEFSIETTRFALDMQLSTLLAYGIAALCLFAACIPLLRLRKHSLAGQPMVFARVASVVKYAIMVPCAMLVGVVFYYIGDVPAMIFGCAIGGVLSFMLLNVILLKNPRAYFHNIKGLAIFAVVFALCTFLLAADVLHIDTYLPDTGMVDHAAINFNGEWVDFYKQENIQAVNDLMDCAQTEDDPDYQLPRVYLKTRYTLNGGLQLEKQAELSVLDQPRTSLLQLYESDEFRESVLSECENQIFLHLTFCTYTGSSYEYSTRSLDQQEIETFMQLLRQAVGNDSLFSADRGPIVATVSGGFGPSIPIYLDARYDACVKWIAEHSPNGILLTNQTLDAYISGISQATVTDLENHPLKDTSDPEEIRELFLNSMGLITGDDWKLNGGNLIYFTFEHDSEYFGPSTCSYLWRQ